MARRRQARSRPSSAADPEYRGRYSLHKLLSGFLGVCQAVELAHVRVLGTGSHEFGPRSAGKGNVHPFLYVIALRGSI